MSENAELTRPVDEAGSMAGPGATVEAGRLDRSLEMGKSVAEVVLLKFRCLAEDQLTPLRAG